ncbi:MAG: RecX family transcriptional regulator, partial [Clostridia bacterium]|nr:RecX family transcriptional regulator [Clostridia bacterium]
GIDAATAEKAVNSLDIDREIGIIKVIEKYHLTKDSTPKERDRVIRRLLNMGYSFSDISKYINIYE